MAADTPILELNQISTFYDEAQVLENVNLKVMEGEAVALLGRNGVGKTTTLRSIMGLTPASTGTVSFKGHDITHMPTNEIANMGLGWVPDDRRIFPTLTVQQNLEIAHKAGPNGQVHWDLESVYGHFPKLRSMAKHKGDTLSGGEQQMLCIARTLMGNPELILLDEPSEGLAPLIVREVMNLIQELTELKITTVLVEQNAPMALRLCAKVHILEGGKNAYEGVSSDLIADKDLMNKLLSV